MQQHDSADTVCWLWSSVLQSYGGSSCILCRCKLLCHVCYGTSLFVFTCSNIFVLLLSSPWFGCTSKCKVQHSVDCSTLFSNLMEGIHAFYVGASFLVICVMKVACLPIPAATFCATSSFLGLVVLPATCLSVPRSVKHSFCWRSFVFQPYARRSCILCGCKLPYHVCHGTSLFVFVCSNNTYYLMVILCLLHF